MLDLCEDDALKLNYEFGGSCLKPVAYSIEVSLSAMSDAVSQQLIADFAARAAMSMKNAVEIEESNYRERLQAKRMLEEDESTPEPTKRAKVAPTSEHKKAIYLNKADGTSSLGFNISPRATLQRAIEHFAGEHGVLAEDLRVYLHGREVDGHESIESVSCRSWNNRENCMLTVT